MSRPHQDNGTLHTPDPDPPHRLSRRTLVRLGWFVGGLIVLGAQAWIILKLFFNARALQKTAGPLPVGTPDQFPRGSVTHLWKKHLLIVRQPEGYLALSDQCTHSQCRIDYLAEQRLLFCPCHGSTFSLAGDVISGPATRSLMRYATRLEAGQVIVDTARPLSPKTP